MSDLAKLLDLIKETKKDDLTYYAFGSNPLPIITNDIKKMASKITPQKIEKGESIFDIFK